MELNNVIKNKEENETVNNRERWKKIKIIVNNLRKTLILVDEED